LTFDLFSLAEWNLHSTIANSLSFLIKTSISCDTFTRQYW
jgi:hypothetical protein